jgi:hypothetical protein
MFIQFRPCQITKLPNYQIITFSFSDKTCMMFLQVCTIARLHDIHNYPITQLPNYPITQTLIDVNY